MSELKYTFTIDGEVWTEKQLYRAAYERNLHVLHQMKRHGIEIKGDETILSDDDIDYLTAGQAWELSINTRAHYTGAKIVEIYKDSLARSDKMWRELGFAQDKPMKVSRCNMSVSGMTVQEFLGVMGAMQADERVGLAVHPEHFATVITMEENRLFGIEPFGMYGTPTLCEVKMKDVSELGAQIQGDRDPEYPISMAGAAFLTDGVTAINSPYHQFRPTENGFDAKTAVYWPEGTVDEIVSGHCLHLAIEFYGGLKQLEKRL